MTTTAHTPVGRAVPPEYRGMTDDALKRRIAERKSELGDELLVLCHHYQRKEVVPFGDRLGDSFALSRDAAVLAAANPRLRHIMFCGVHFMAESADILTGGRLNVHLPNPYAGCPMADMAPEYEVLSAWDELAAVVEPTSVVPVSYMNSAASLKAFCGANGGLVCTSSNAARALAWAFERGERAFFFPDQHLGRNTANAMGVPREAIVVYDPHQPLGGLTPDEVRRARVILWKGHCHVHKNFEPRHIEAFRRRYPEGKVVVHPECEESVVQAADAAGSTSFIVEYVRKAPVGSVIAVGTELNLIGRLAEEYKDKTILELTGQDCPLCVNMFRTSLADLAYTLDHVGEVNLVRVDAAVRAHALTALERMVALA